MSVSALGALFQVGPGLLAERYRTTLAAIGGRSTGLASFHVDAAGWSPEVAQELGSPCYLGQGPDHPFFLVVSPSQLAGPWAVPNAGYAEAPFRAWADEALQALARLTLREAVFGPFEHGVCRFAQPEDLDLARTLSLPADTPSGRVRSARTLAGLGREFTLSDAAWRDDALIDRMVELAERAGDAVDAAEALEPGSRAVGSFALPVPGIGWCWLWRDAGSEPCVLVPPEHASGGPGSPERIPLEPGAAFAFLTRRGLASINAVTPPGGTARLERKLGWLALDHLLAAAGDQELGDPAPEAVARHMHLSAAPPADWLELADVNARLVAGAPVNEASLSPLTRLRLLLPEPADGPTAAWVRHLLAGLDDADPLQLYQDAPALFFQRYPTWPETRRRLVDLRLAAQAGR